MAIYQTLTPSPQPSPHGRGSGINAGKVSKSEALVADRNAPQRHVWRTRIVLLSADGLGANAIMAAAGKGRGSVNSARFTRAQRGDWKPPLWNRSFPVAGSAADLAHPCRASMAHGRRDNPSARVFAGFVGTAVLGS
jgi:hypothetical protein